MEENDMSQRILQNASLSPIAAPAVNSGLTVIDSFGSILSEITLFFVLFGMAGTIEAQKLKRQLKKVTALLTGLVMQFIVMPCLGYVSIVIFHNQGLSYSQSITLLIVTSSPGGTFSNLWCSLFNADLALSVAMTSFSSVFGIGFLPANIALYSYIARISGVVPVVNGNITKSVDFKHLATSLGILIAGVALGILASYKFGRRFRRVAHVIGSISGAVLIALSAVFATLGNRGDSKPWNQKLGFYAGVAFPSLVGIFTSVFVSSLFCKHPKPDIMTIAIESAFQNIAIAASAAFNVFSTKTERGQALCVPVIYGAFTTLFTSIFCLIAWKLGWSKAPRNISLLRMITTSYELEIDEDIEDHMTLYAFFNHDIGSQRNREHPIQRYKRKVRIPIITLPAGGPSPPVLSNSSTAKMSPAFTMSNFEPPAMTGSTLDMTDYFFHFLAEGPEDVDNESLEQPDAMQPLYDETAPQIHTKEPNFIVVEGNKDDRSDTPRTSLCSAKAREEPDPKIYVRVDSNYHDEICDWLTDGQENQLQNVS